MAGRYLALAAAGPLGIAAERLRQFAAETSEFSIVFDEPSLLLIAEPSLLAHELDGGRLVGTVFRKGCATPVADFAPFERAQIARSAGSALTNSFWGDFVAVFRDAGKGKLRVLRSPFGRLPCCFARSGEAVAITSDAGLLLAAGLLEPKVDWPAVARHLAHPDIRWAETCLVGLSELRGGTRLTVEDGAPYTEPLWSPWAFAAAERQIDDPSEAAHGVSGAVLQATKASAATCQRSLLLLSGGLDSSIVAAALARAGASFVCLTLVGDDPAGDEREYARLTADAVGARLIEVRRASQRVDIRRSSAARLPCPGARSFTQDADAVVLEAAQRHEAAAVFDGGGGDNVFYGILSVAPIADALRTSGPGKIFWSTARALADLSQTGMPTIVGKALRRAWLRSSAPRLPASSRFLSEIGREWVAAAEKHPWYDPPQGVLPGKAIQVAALAPAQLLVEAVDPLAPLGAISPLVTQPVVEACLAVQSWLWFEPGRNRAIARRAFEGDLPREIINRRSKGTPNAFVASLFELHRGQIGSLLLGGHLAEQGLLDSARLSAVLADQGPIHGFDYARVMELVDVEAWLRAWC
jgi:asparagine synthase (glutamine-hydrolysing)